MTDQELKKMNRLELLEILVKQGERIEELEKELAETKAQLESRRIRLEKAGSIADAALQITDIFTKAQEAADLYLENVKAGAGTASGTAGNGKRSAAAGGDSSPGTQGAAADAEGDSAGGQSLTGEVSGQDIGEPEEAEEFPEEPEPAAQMPVIPDSGDHAEEPEHWFEDSQEPEDFPLVKGVSRKPDPVERAVPDPRAEYTKAGPAAEREFRYGGYEENEDENGFHWLDDI